MCDARRVDGCGSSSEIRTKTSFQCHQTLDTLRNDARHGSARQRIVSNMISATRQAFISAIFISMAPPQTVHRSISMMSDEVILTPIVENSARPSSAKAAVGQQGQEDRHVCGWIGVQVSPMTAAFAVSLGMAVPYGAIFERPEPGSPAARAEIAAGDVITAINGSPLRSWSDFTSIISMMAPGTDVYLTTYRNTQLVETKVTLGSSKCPLQLYYSPSTGLQPQTE
jgi:S1-C subfamily serine protease